MRILLQDAGYAFRSFARAPGFTVAALLSLALAIGANTAIFSVTSALLLHPLPYRDAERLVILWNRSPGLNIAEDWFSTAQYFDIRNGHSGFEQLAIAIGGNYNLTGSGRPERIGAVRASSNLPPILGVQPALGRLFTTAEDGPGSGVVLLNHGTWMRRYGGDPRVLGRSLTLNGQSYRIVGVIPVGFSLPREVLPTLGGAEDAEVMVSLPLPASAATDRNHEDYNIIGKLKPGVTVERAQAEMSTITARLRRDHPDFYPPNGGLTFSIVPLLDQVVGNVRQSLLILAAAVGFVLLIACANVANLLLSRAVGRQKEIAVRAALGAGRMRIVRQLLTESILLGLLGGTLGMFVAFWSVRWIRAMGEGSIPRLHDIGLNVEVALFTFFVSLLSGALFGLAPAIRLRGLDLNNTLKEAGRGSSGSQALWARGNHTRRILVISELALCGVLLTGAGLLLRSFARVLSVPPGFNPQGLLTFGLTMTGSKYVDPQVVAQTYRRLTQKIEDLPGVALAGAVSALPLSNMFAWGPITIEGRMPPAGERFINADMRFVSGHYFQAMQIPLIRGRHFNESDTKDNPRVALIDERMAGEFWPNTNPVGERFHIGGVNESSPWITIVGVVGNVKQYTLDSDSRIAVYLAHNQYPVREMNVVLRSEVAPVTLANQAKAAVLELDADLPVYHVGPMSGRVNQSLARRRFAMVLLSLFAGLALVLAAIGVYGLMAYLVTQGTREIGIRIALGATQRVITRMIVVQALSVLAPGIICGLGAALLFTRLIRSLLFGITASDPITFIGVPALLVLIGLIAAYVPATRAAAVDPMLSLRSE